MINDINQEEQGDEIRITKLKCLACEYEWFPRITRDGHVKPPKVCARCKSKTWNKEAIK